ncbi:choice-of-anchor D domain-containing protein [Marinicella rhabdoformis]|uniref:choice-of-anchor D domain-containing protein n=1 Tax=Marinicella rhabdoformis TaxID=2580566 RepID=UPI0012AECE1C|nr:choice-of-anchor D domain-containing protein [Marinicella rhabdoformis]
MKNQKTTNLTSAIAFALTCQTCTAESIEVSEATDDGTGLIENSLSWAIHQANINETHDIIELQTDVLLTGVMKRLIDSDVTIESSGARKHINGNQQFRPLFIKSGQVTINNVDIIDGSAIGGNSSKGGAGAGLGGGLFIYDGQVKLNNITFDNNQSKGGLINQSNIQGGGGMFGRGNYYGGGGLFGDAIGNYVNGGYGGYGNYRDNDPHFGGGGGYAPPPYVGGFGGGGSFSYNFYGNRGGFGGGGGSTYADSPNFAGGNGGFGAGGGLSQKYNNHGEAGFAATNQNAAGLGGAVFIRSGQLVMSDVVIQNNHSLSSGQAQGLGGGMFILHNLNNSNSNNQGMPDKLPRVFACGMQYIDNSADSDDNSLHNNNNIYDSAARLVSTQGGSEMNACLHEQEILVSGNNVNISSGDDTPNTEDNTDFGTAVFVYQTISKTFKIKNSGNSLLILNKIELINDTRDPFKIVSDLTTDHLHPNESTNFRIKFTPNQLFSESHGLINIKSNAPNQNYNFEIKGRSVHDFIFRDHFE